MKTFWVDGINPEPWTAPEGSMGRRGGKLVVRYHSNEALRVYQDAVAEAFEQAYPQESPLDGEVVVWFSFWRNTGTYLTFTGRKARKQHADATNLQKALEDALQGVLYMNDNQVRAISSVIEASGPDVEPRIEVAIAPWIGSPSGPFAVDYGNPSPAKRTATAAPADNEHLGAGDLRELF